MGRTTDYCVPRSHGPRIVAIGGGHGLSNMLRGLKQYTENLTAIVTVADDGGGSGVLRQDLGMPPPGDIRNCLEALANTEPLMAELMHYRFSDGSLSGQSFGNLFLAALNGISPSFDEAVARMSDVLAITGRVLPVTCADVRLEAEFENGARVEGESKIFYCKKEQDCRIARVRLLPEHPRALPAALSAIRDADMIVLGPGSLYTSIIPNLLVSGIVGAISESDALKVYVCNVMTQEGETEGYTVADHMQAIFQHSAAGLFQLCLTNSSPIPKGVAARYQTEGAEPIRCDAERCAALGVELLHRPVSTVENGFVRHHPGHLARELILLHAERSVRIAGDRFDFADDSYQIEQGISKR
ncbi:MAG: YvcK family protein [Oscillospiraceae bacterium]